MGGLTASHPEAQFLLYLLIGDLQRFRLCGPAPPRHIKNILTMVFGNQRRLGQNRCLLYRTQQ
jgi:hypothetical protein